MAVGWGLVGKHLGEEDKGGVSLSITQIGSYQSVVKKGVHPFWIRGSVVCIVEQISAGDQDGMDLFDLVWFWIRVWVFQQAL